MTTQLNENLEINVDFQQFDNDGPEPNNMTINETANRDTEDEDPFCHFPKTNFEKLLSVICAFLVLSLIITLSVKGVSQKTETTEADTSFCLSEGCIAAAAQFMVNMDTSKKNILFFC